jgi:hypothetical protein
VLVALTRFARPAAFAPFVVPRFLSRPRPAALLARSVVARARFAGALGIAAGLLLLIAGTPSAAAAARTCATSGSAGARRFFTVGSRGIRRGPQFLAWFLAARFGLCRLAVAGFLARFGFWTPVPACPTIAPVRPRFAIGPLLALRALLTFRAAFAGLPRFPLLLAGLRVGDVLRFYFDVYVARAQPEQALASFIDNLDLHFVQFCAKLAQGLLDGLLARLGLCFDLSHVFRLLVTPAWTAP